MPSPGHKGPQSPHSNKTLADVFGAELEAWAAAELDGFTGVSKKADGSYEGTKNGKKPIPQYRTAQEVTRLATRTINGSNRLVLTKNGAPVPLATADAAKLELCVRALVLHSMNNRGAL